MISWEETCDGAWAMAAPVRDDEDHALGAFGVAVPIPRHTPAVGKSNLHAVIDVAARGLPQPFASASAPSTVESSRSRV